MNPGEFAVRDMDLQTVKTSITAANFPDLKYIMLSGNYGDPIYHPDFHSVIGHFKNEGMQLRIDTNGSARRTAWWRETARILQRNDRVTFSIDGLKDTNSIYRANANWEDIMRGVSMLRGKVLLQWKFIVFKHNEHQLREAQEMARELGFDEFKLVKSNRFGGKYAGPKGDDQMAPAAEWRA